MCLGGGRDGGHHVFLLPPLAQRGNQGVGAYTSCSGCSLHLGIFLPDLNIGSFFFSICKENDHKFLD